MDENRDILGHRLHDLNKDSAATLHEAAVIPTTGGSYALAQLWRHRLFDFGDLPPDAKDAVFGKTQADDKYICDAKVDLESRPDQLAFAIDAGLPEGSHVARMIGVDQDGNRLRIVRQSMPCGGIAPGPVDKDNIHEPGLFFLGFSRDPLVFDYMLKRMAGQPIRDPSRDKRPCDEVMRYSQCLRGQLFYIPSLQQLDSLANLRL